MAAAGALKELCEEASCSICLDYFRDPVMIAECGHNFCRACLSRHWGASGATEASCPQCRGKAQEGGLHSNVQLANFVEIIQKFFLLEAKGEEGGGGVCEKHREPLKFFCREDEAPLCLVCSKSREYRDHQVAPLEEEEAAGEKETIVTGRRERACQKHQEPLKLFCEDHEALICVDCEQSQEHQYHKIIPVEEASQVYKDQFCTCVEILRKERNKILAYKDSLVKESQDLLKQTRGEQQKMLTKFRQLHTFLDKQEKLLLAQMEEVEKGVAKKRDQHLTELSEELSSLESLIREMEEKSQQPAGDFLQDARSTLQRYEEKAALENPEAFPLALKWRIWNFSDLNPLLEGIQKQLKGNEEMLHGPLLCRLAPAGDAQASCVLPAASQSAGVTNTAPDLVPWPSVSVQAPRVVPPYKYASSVHSLHATVQPLQASQPAVHMRGQGSLTASVLAAASPQEQKQMLGDRLFPLIQAMHPTLAGKITGMLLELDNSQLLHMLESPVSLRSKVEEAVAVLQAHQAKEAAARIVGVLAATSSARKSACKKAK